MIDTHAHLDIDDFRPDLAAVISRAQTAGIERIFVPATDSASCQSVLATCAAYPQYLFPMLGLHPEEVRDDYREQLAAIHTLLTTERARGTRIIAIGEVGLDYYWSRDYARQQQEALREQIEWSIALQLPLMLHCRKATGEMIHLLADYRSSLVGGVFHCFTGNEQEARALLQFDNFVLGIGGVLTFKNSPLPMVLPRAVPLDRLVLETDAPYMSPVPKRGTRNESANVPLIAQRLAEAYDVPMATIAAMTTANAVRIFNI